MASFKLHLADKVSAAGFDAECTVRYEEVVFAVCKLKANKDDGDVGLSSNYFLHACNELYVHISFLFSCLLVHAVARDRCNLSTVVPIPKGKNVCLSDSANYRHIATSSVLGKLLYLVVLDRFHDQLCMSDLQFGFRSRQSTYQCTMVLKETILYYVNNGSAACLCTSVIKYVRWSSNMRIMEWYFYDRLSVYNGVEQGGVLSPVLFCLSTDGLLEHLSHSKIGCNLLQFLWVLWHYADDVLLLTPTASAMHSLLKICDEYANEYRMIFNGKKSACIDHHINTGLPRLVIIPHFMLMVSQLNM